MRNRKSTSEKAVIHQSKNRHRIVQNKFFIHRGSFQKVREDGEMAGKYLMVNLQDSRKSCTEQNLNVWKDPKLRKLVSDHFIFWQICKSNPYGKWYEVFYKPTQYPYGEIVDPRTGEKLEEWHQVNYEIISDHTEKFLAMYKNEWDRSSKTDGESQSANNE